MSLSNVDSDLLARAMCAVMDDVSTMSKQFPPDSINILAYLSRPLICGLMQTITGQENVSGSDPVPMTPDQSNQFILTLLAMGIMTGRIYATQELSDPDGPTMDIPPRFNN